MFYERTEYVSLPHIWSSRRRLENARLVHRFQRHDKEAWNPQQNQFQDWKLRQWRFPISVIYPSLSRDDQHGSSPEESPQRTIKLRQDVVVKQAFEAIQRIYHH